MPSALIRQIDSEVYDQLKQHAKQHGRSLEAEIRMILRESTCEMEVDMFASAQKIKKSFGGRKFPDSTSMIRADREHGHRDYY